MIESNEKQVLSVLVNIFSALNMPMIVVGAGARLLIFDQEFGQGRGTKDWDIAISIDRWEDYQQIREALINGDSPCFEDTRITHKFIHINTNIEVDIVPFGEIGKPDQKIVWPETGNSMNVLGFTEAMLSAKHITIDDFEIKVIDIPAFIVLKIFAWGDRGERTNKDLEDIDFILSKYENDDRVYNELAEELADGVIELLDANIYLLGQDIYKILQSKTLLELNLLLNKLLDKFDDEPGTLGYKLEILKKGISSFSSDNVI